jgi:hypothetical protein
MEPQDAESPIAGDGVLAGVTGRGGQKSQKIVAPDNERAGHSKHLRSRRSSAHTDDALSINAESLERPPLPPRPTNLNLLAHGSNTPGSLRVPRSSRPQLQSQATTALSLKDIQTQSHPGGARETYANSTKWIPSGESTQSGSPIGQLKGGARSDGDESASLRSYVPTGTGDVESILGDVVGAGQQSPAWRLLYSQFERSNPFDALPYDGDELTADFDREFYELGEPNIENGTGNYEHLLLV